jgi:Fe2+ or Zn2+ uptake regulation protein
MNTIHNTIKTLGGRLTKTRKAIIEILSDNHCFLTKAEIVQKLQDKKIKPDRTTFYRELLF